MPGGGLVVSGGFEAVIMALRREEKNHQNGAALCRISVGIRRA
jgi:hypothetical protein